MRMENAVPSIIDRETWERVQKKMEDNRRVQAGRPPKAREYPLKGKVFCRECKSAMTIVSSKKTYYYYACSGKSEPGNAIIRRSAQESWKTSSLMLYAKSWEIRET